MPYTKKAGVLTLQFGLGDLATCSCDCCPAISFESLDNAASIGLPVAETNKGVTIAIMEFVDPDSIEVVIDALNRAKSNLLRYRESAEDTHE